jgi:hypothetical protein
LAGTTLDKMRTLYSHPCRLSTQKAETAHVLPFESLRECLPFLVGDMDLTICEYGVSRLESSSVGVDAFSQRSL